MTFAPFLRWLETTALIAFAVTFSGIVLASALAYGISRARFNHGTGSLLKGLFITLIVPAMILVPPFYFIVARLGLAEACLGVALIYFGTVFPFCLWQLKVCYDSIPRSIEEAAMIDGASRWQSFYLVLLPVAAPTLVVTAILSLIAAWCEYLAMAVFARDLQQFQLPVALQKFAVSVGVPGGVYAATALLFSVPIALMFFLFLRHLYSASYQRALHE